MQMVKWYHVYIKLMMKHCNDMKMLDNDRDVNGIMPKLT